ncbi:hypothetical protein N474_22895 [Pseudoalteromonas luteoviolacea CPMOR-2]|uniref:PEGA domain-containing protein n=1 Tax=Pseudoalteromonas luteoviolacea DSM 6061 TaxID=1365250 RepID=A0A162A331_9GAMM|nr:hypothetical protein [Pseudoalteromonas luteoviolacea]KZN43271.1 hypothetical protein N475_09210 [Pseudoalteromonas luteoviolacea DSM 6061]KZN52686.1 hypothetical protein N474_22895 [Pseudoalteromonas luteoviolacea CPMOR-2]MBE0385462.1 hypothetical protein [Pseudoalteromonas luteoviolacea DSM 6061]
MKYLLIILLSFSLVACIGDEHLRGQVEPSQDGKTYFGIVDDNGGRCGSLLFDGKPWDLPLSEVVEIEAGEHTIYCGASISFIVPEGVVFKFDYWGP